MGLDKRNISISFGQGIDTKTDPNQVIPGKLLSLTDATLGETLALQKRNGYTTLGQLQTAVSSSSLTNQKLSVFNNQLISLDGKALNSISNGMPIFVDNFIGAQPSITTIQREATPIINQDLAHNQNYNTYSYTWASSCIAPNYQQLSFSSAVGKFEITSPNGSVIASTGLSGFVKNKVFSFGNFYYWTGINYASSTLNYYQVPANGSSAYFNNSVSIGSVGGDFSANTSQTGFNRYQRYDGVVVNNNLYVGWFNPATSSISLSLVTVSGVTTTKSFQADASGALGVFGDNNYVWLVYHNGATSAGFAVYSTSAMIQASGPNPWFTTDSPTAANQVSLPQLFTGTSNGLAANVYTQWLNYYPPTQYSGATISWPTAQRSDFISKQSLSGALNSTSGTSSVVIRGMGFASRAFNYLGDDFFLSAYGGTQTSTSADRLEPTYFLVSPTKATNNIVSKLAFQNGAGYDFQTGGQYNNLNNNYGAVGYGVPLSNVYANGNQFTVPYLIKTQATPLSSTSLIEPFFISYNFGLNSAVFNFNATTLNQGVSYGNNLNIASGYLTAFDGKSVTENNFHLFPEDVQIVGSSSFGPPANTYSYQVLYQYQDAQGNIFRSAPSKTYSITTAGSSAMYLLVPTIRATNKTNVQIRAFRNAPTIDTLTFHEVNPLNPALNNPNIDNVVILDSNTDAQIIGNPDIYTTGNVIEDTGAPSPTWISTYKLRLMMSDAESGNIWFSKEVIPGTSVEMSDLQTFSISQKFGNVICHIEMDDKFIIFTKSIDGSLGAIYYMTGEGPDNTGNNNDFSLPILITTTLTTNNPNSVVLTPDGVMFSSDKGIWVLGHDLSTSYIGSPVEAFNGTTITSANLIPGVTQVRFTLNTGICLVWDYFQRQWSTFLNINATHGLIYQGLFSYLSQQNQKALVLQETPGVYTDNGRPILIGLTTSWLSLAGLQGYQRAYRLYVMGKYQSAHLLSVSMAYDFNPGIVQTAVINPIQNQNQSWGSDPFWGSVISWGGRSQLEQNRVNLVRQKCQSVQITIQEQLNPANLVYGGSLILENIGIVIGGKLSYPKLPPNRSVQ